MFNYVHIPVMLAEVLEALNPSPQGRYFDGTVGGAGHAAAILARSAPTGRRFGSDRDGAAVAAARGRLAEFEGRAEIRQATFAAVGEWLEPGVLDGALLDLGLSSPQLDQAERGFSFQADGPLDMRMDPRQETTAADLLATATAAELARMFWKFGGEPEGRRLASVIVEERRYRPLHTTGQLAGLVERIKPRHGQRAHPATRVFQALRMAVNDEVGELGRGLAAVWKCLKVSGRLVVVTFHSGEDRLVKDFGKQMALPYTYPGEVDVPAMRVPREPGLRVITRKAVAPGPAELAANPRSRSAQMRVFEKLRHE